MSSTISFSSVVFQQQSSAHVPSQLTQLNHHYSTIPYDHTQWLGHVIYSPFADDFANIDDLLFTGTAGSSSSSGGGGSSSCLPDSSIMSTTPITLPCLGLSNFDNSNDGPLHYEYPDDICKGYCQLFDDGYESSLYNTCWDNCATSSNELDIAPKTSWFHGHRTFDYGSENNTTTITEVGRYTAEERRDKILRYLKKKNQRNFRKTIKYACRKTLADRRVRIRGRFAKNQDEEFHANNYINQDQVVNTVLPDLGVHENHSYCDEDWLQEAMEILMHASVAGPCVR